jgi:hypothetical protein
LQHKLQVPQILSVILRSPDPLYRILWPQMWHCAGVSISALKRGNRRPGSARKTNHIKMAN